MAIYHKKGISATQLSIDISVTLKTARFLLQKIRTTFHVVHREKLEGEVELDETFVGGKNKKSKKMSRKKFQGQGTSHGNAATQWKRLYVK